MDYIFISLGRFQNAEVSQTYRITHGRYSVWNHHPSTCAGWRQRKYKRSTFTVMGIYWWPVHKGPVLPLQWRHNRRDGVSNHQPHDYLLSCLFRSRSKKTSKLRITDLCAGISPVTGEFQRVSTQTAIHGRLVPHWKENVVILTKYSSD